MTAPTKPTITHLEPFQRESLGRAARIATPRSSQAAFAPAPDRPDPVTLLESQAATRLPELVPLRYSRMLASPFAFYRGAAMIMAADLAKTGNTGINVQLCGDAHLSNFGLFASPERQLVFDLNDFDETLPGPWEWDVKRMAASFEVAGRGNRFSAEARRSIVLAAVGEYRHAMARFASMNNLQVWYTYLPVDRTLELFRKDIGQKTFKRTGRVLEKAKARDHLQAYGKMVHLVNGEPRFASDPPLLVPIEELLNAPDAQALNQQVRSSLRAYRASLSADRRRLIEQFRFVHLARKVVGVGSVGTRAWVALMLGRDSQDPLLLQMKEAQRSVLEGFLPRSPYANSGQRVVVGQRLMQASSDILLGWQRSSGFDNEQRDFYLRQLRDWKGSVEVEQMSAPSLSAYGRLCGWTLARAHARSGDRIAISAYLGSRPVFDEAIADFSTAYADQNERDFAALSAAARSGRIVT